MSRRTYATKKFFPDAMPQAIADLTVTDEMRTLVHRFRRCSDVLASSRAEIAAMSSERRQAVATEIAAVLETVNEMRYVAKEAAERVRLA